MPFPNYIIFILDVNVSDSSMSFMEIFFNCPHGGLENVPNFQFNSIDKCRYSDDFRALRMIFLLALILVILFNRQFLSP